MRFVSAGLVALICVGLLVPVSFCRAELPVPADQGIVGLHQRLKRLSNTTSLLHVVAHPDDEDGGMLTYVSRGLGARTMLFSITRGEGGANLISSDFFDALGILRTLEHREASRYYGIQVFYSHAVDYGYSKTLGEAKRQWQEGKPVLADLVRLVRQQRPDIIAARFRGTRHDGHGHHQMSGVIAQEAFHASADPDRFPEQIAAGLRPWQPSKLYHDNIRPQWRNEDNALWTLEVPTGEFDPVLGRSYAQVARHGLGFQRSQGISGFDTEGGPSVSYYRRINTSGLNVPEGKEQTFFDGIDTSYTGLLRFTGSKTSERLPKKLNELDQTIARARADLRAVNITGMVHQLSQGLGLLRNTIAWLSVRNESDSNQSDSNQSDYGSEEILFRLRAKQAQFEQIIAMALGLEFRATAVAQQSSQSPSGFNNANSGFEQAIPGQTFWVALRVVNRGQIPIGNVSLRVETPGSWDINSTVSVNALPAADAVQGNTGQTNTRQGNTEQTGEPLSYNGVRESLVKVMVPEDASSTQPYWRRDSIRETFYSIDDSARQGWPLPESPAKGVLRFEVDGQIISLRVPVQVRFRDPKLGAVEYPLAVEPRVSIAFDNEFGILPFEQKTYRVTTRVRNAGTTPAQGAVRLILPKGWECIPESQSFSLEKSGAQAVHSFDVIPLGNLTSGEYVLRAEAECDGKIYRQGFRVITAPDLQRCFLFQPAEHKLRAADLKIAPGLVIGYVMGSGDEVPGTLEQLGVSVDMLDSEDLADGALDQFDAVVIGVRAYAVRPDLIRSNERLLDYVHSGGVMIVQYQTPEFDHNFGPYPYTMGRGPEEVSEEDAPVTILRPDNPLFLSPNAITPGDFDGWVEQRGSKFWQKWDKHYIPLLESHDHDQAPQSGGMMYAKHGKGLYIYSAYAWYRQLPQGVPGAYRIYANLLSLRHTLQ